MRLERREGSIQCGGAAQINQVEAFEEFNS
jgi:hypothetical protein